MERRDVCRLRARAELLHKTDSRCARRQRPGPELSGDAAKAGLSIHCAGGNDLKRTARSPRDCRCEPEHRGPGAAQTSGRRYRTGGAACLVPSYIAPMVCGCGCCGHSADRCGISGVAEVHSALGSGEPKSDARCLTIRESKQRSRTGLFQRRDDGRNDRPTRKLAAIETGRDRPHFGNDL